MRWHCILLVRGYGTGLYILEAPLDTADPHQIEHIPQHSSDTQHPAMHASATFPPLSASPVNSSTPRSRFNSQRPALATGRSIKQRLESCRGFDLDDDEEFCPMLVNSSQQHYLLGGSPRSPSQLDTDHFAPNRYFSSPRADHSDDRATPDCVVPAPTFSRYSPRGSKALLIIDPSTGLSVSSPLSRGAR